MQILRTFPLVLGFMLVTVPALGASITWKPVDSIANNSAGEEILTTGTYKFAWDAHHSTTTTPGDLVVRGITFYEDPEALRSSGGVFIDRSNLTIAWTTGTVGNSVNTGWSGNFRTLMDSTLASASGIGGGIRIANLTPGNSYQVQILLHVEGAGFLTQPRPVCDNELPANCTSPITHFTLPAESVVGTFTADASFQQIVFPGAVGRAVFNAIAISEVTAVTSVPEPTSTLSLLALGTLGAASTLKRKLKSSQSTEKETTKVG
ncbi:PEP-CTERM sorting domain-containing protein [Microcystis aeruginosa]|uniref:PEP-CTERM sorting domain-containing protein n=1 Tax=Microcystis aeruginosa TaxID=1126 RepID=UPI0021AB2966|nr:PEP-CTERM sorting domain-containing protein [Microcystis aeruginosa]